jgi:hypothetical protein
LGIYQLFESNSNGSIATTTTPWKAALIKSHTQLPSMIKRHLEKEREFAPLGKFIDANLNAAYNIEAKQLLIYTIK